MAEVSVMVKPESFKQLSFLKSQADQLIFCIVYSNSP